MKRPGSSLNAETVVMQDVPSWADAAGIIALQTMPASVAGLLNFMVEDIGERLRIFGVEVKV